MASTTINPDGTITVTMTTQDQALAQMILADKGADALTEVFNLWFANMVKSVMNARFAGMSPADQVTVLTKMEAAKPVVGP